MKQIIMDIHIFFLIQLRKLFEKNHMIDVSSLDMIFLIENSILQFDLSTPT